MGVDVGVVVEFARMQTGFPRFKSQNEWKLNDFDPKILKDLQVLVTSKTVFSLWSLLSTTHSITSI